MMEQRHRFSSPGTAGAALQSQWEAFQARGAILDGVRPEIAASWQRCNALELTSQMPAVPLDEGALRGFDHAGQAPRQFLGLARQLAADLGAELADTTSAVIVCDDFGVVLSRTGSPEVLRRAYEVNLVPGGVWSERFMASAARPSPCATRSPRRCSASSAWPRATTSRGHSRARWWLERGPRSSGSSRSRFSGANASCSSTTCAVAPATRLRS